MLKLSSVMRLAVRLLFLVLALASISVADPCRSDLLPAPAWLILQRQFPEWRPKRFSDLIPDDQRLWQQAHMKDCPGISSGHFESDDSIAYAVLLVPKSGDRTSYKLAMLSQTSGHYNIRLLDAGKDAGALSLVISKVPPGAYSAFENTQTIRLRRDGLNVEWLEKSSTLYYWTRGRYRSIATSD